MIINTDWRNRSDLLTFLQGYWKGSPCICVRLAWQLVTERRGSRWKYFTAIGILFMCFCELFSEVLRYVLL